MAPTEEPSASSEPGARPTILIAEDDYLIAEELTQCCAARGYAVVGPVASNGAAERVLGERGRPDAALLDVMLSDGPCLGLVAELKRLGVPVVLISGIGPRAITPDLQGLPLVGKPFDEESVVRALESALGEPRS